MKRSTKINIAVAAVLFALVSALVLVISDDARLRRQLKNATQQIEELRAEADTTAAHLIAPER